MGLPQHVDQVRVWRSPELAEGPLYALVTPYPHQGTFDADVVDMAGNHYVHLGGYRTVEIPVNAEALKILRTVLSLELVTA